MLSRLWRALLIFLLVALFAAGSTAAFSQAAPVQDQPVAGPGTDYQALLAIASGRAPAQLRLADAATIILMNGQRLVRVKAVDAITGEVLSATFDGAAAVNETALRARVTAEWRSLHGAMTLDLVNKLAALAPGERIDIGIWLKADVQPLPKTEHLYTPPTDLQSSDAPSAEVLGPLSPATDEKTIAQPLAADQVPPEVRAAAGVIAAADAQPAGADKPGATDVVADVPLTPDVAAAQAAVAAFKRQNDAFIQAQVAPVQTRFLSLLQARGLEAQVQYASQNAPITFLSGLTRQQVEELAFVPEVDTIYDTRNAGGPALDISRPTQNADLVETFGHYDGTGVNVAVVEGERIFPANPYLTVTGFHDATMPYQAHPTAVGGMIKSTHSSVRGLASGSTLYSANGDGYATAAAMAAAMDWGSDSATVLNNSFWIQDEGTTDVPFLFDRHMDYIVRSKYDFAAVAAGNFGAAGCQYGGSVQRGFVATPGKGYNVLTVGNYDSKGTLGWTDDTMDPCSGANLSGRWKPEVAATGHGINSTTTASPWTGPVGSGTSYASPMVTALAADLIQANATFGDKPEALKAIIMATAMHNIEGDPRLSRKDGTGGIDASAAAVVVERGDFDDRALTSASVLPITFNVYAYKGQRVRFVSTWQSSPTADYSSDPQPVDLDLTAYRTDGTTVIVSSNNGPTTLEIVDFVAPETETYKIKLSYSSGVWPAANTWVGSAWYRGMWAISPDVAYSDPQAKPMGVHLEVRPADWDSTIYWRAFGIRSAATGDHDLSAYSASLFADPSTRSLYTTSAWGTGLTDFMATDGNRATSTPEFYRIARFSGTGGYQLNWSNLKQAFNGPGIYGPFTMGASDVVKVFDIWFEKSKTRRISIIPAAGNTANLGAGLYQSTAGLPASYVQRRSQSVASADTSTAPDATESFKYDNLKPSAWDGLVVYNISQAGGGQFYIMIQDMTYLPLLRNR